PSILFPSSHSRPAAISAGNRMPSPHSEVHFPPPDGQVGSISQNAEQPSPPSVLPSSHCSLPSRMPSPHSVRVQSSPGSSHNQPPPPSGGVGSRRQSEEHPSPSTSLPSSHCSSPAMIPSPHSAATQMS